MTKSEQAYVELVEETKRVKGTFGFLMLEPVEVFLMKLKRKHPRVYRSWLNASAMTNVGTLAMFIVSLDQQTPLDQKTDGTVYDNTLDAPADGLAATQGNDQQSDDPDVAEEGNTPENGEENEAAD